MEPPTERQTSLLLLPPEIVPRLLPARDVEALGVTCCALHGMARDPLPWKDLFERDYAHEYARGVPAMAWPHGDHTVDPWPEFALEPHTRHEIATRLPPCEIAPWAPVPFARVGAMGPRWLYVAHARRIDSRGTGDPLVGTIVVPNANRGDPGKASTVLYRGGVEAVDGAIRPSGHSVKLTIDAKSGDILAWTEGEWRGHDEFVWCVKVHAAAATVIGAVLPTGARPHFEEWRKGGYRTWYTISKDGDRHGHRVH